jgi:serine/threonine protein kinase
VTIDAARPSAAVPEVSLRLAGSLIRSRYRVNAVSSVHHDLVVYSAEDTHKGRSIALKVLRGVFARDAEFVAAVRAQAQALATAAHVLRGVQRVYECGDTETGQLFVALEWVEGATLCDVLDGGGALAAPTALRVAIRVGEALEALHHNHLVYGRLGPDSVVMVNDGERIRLIGAELAAAYRTPIGRRADDPFPLSYRAPEQAEHGDASEATDVYALGMLLQQLMTAGKGEPTPLLPTIQRIIATALELRPERRYPNISVMVNDIWGAAALVAEPESRARSVKASGNPRRRVRRRRPPFALRMAAAVAAAGVTAAIVSVAGLDQLATRLHNRIASPAVTALRVERAVVPPAEVAPPSLAPGEPTAPPEFGAIEDKRPVERRAPVIVRESRVAPRPPMAPRVAPPALARPTIDGRPRPIQESPAPAADSGDGSAAIDWLLTNRR